MKKIINGSSFNPSHITPLLFIEAKFFRRLGFPVGDFLRFDRGARRSRQKLCL
jgi:hypothetical protein